MRGLRLLLVDDEEELVTTLAERLDLRGHHVDAVTDGAEALRRIGTTRYDVAIVDVKMPGVGGMDVLRGIRRLQPSARVILLTGHGAEGEGKEGLKEGAFAYLYKPYRFEDLLDVLQTAVPGSEE